MTSSPAIIVVAIFNNGRQRRQQCPLYCITSISNNALMSYMPVTAVVIAITLPLDDVSNQALQ
jgi:hypothetical protein